jgi:hypothetical protein
MEATALRAAAASVAAAAVNGGTSAVPSASRRAEQSNERALVLPLAGEEDASTADGEGVSAAPGKTESVRASALIRALEMIPQEVARMLLRRAFMLRQTSKALKRAVEGVAPAMQIKVKRGTSVAQLEGGVIDMQKWCFVAALDLSAVTIGAEGAGRLAAVLVHEPVDRPPAPRLQRHWSRGGGSAGGGAWAVPVDCLPGSWSQRHWS